MIYYESSAFRYIINHMNEGLHSGQLAALREKFGYNELPERTESALTAYAKNFWGPLPWLLELIVAISFLSGRQVEAVVMGGLLLINGFISLYQHRSADKALASLRSQLNNTARALRDGNWVSLPSRELLPGDVARVRTGDIVPADGKVLEGTVSADFSSLTGESVPRDVSVGEELFAGAVVRRGEATLAVSAIGIQTKFGKTAEMLELSHPPTHMERVIFALIRSFFVLNATLALGISVYALWAGIPAENFVVFVIVLLVTSVPVAFPTMFAVAQSYGALQMSKGHGVLVRRLAAVQEGASMDVLCVDKTGTLTENRLQVSEAVSYGTYSRKDLIQLAAACSNEADRDAIDTAIFQAASDLGLSSLKQCGFTPFDPSTKRTEACVEGVSGQFNVQKGLPDMLLAQVTGEKAGLVQDLDRLCVEGLRVVAVIANPNGEWECVGLIGFADPVRSEVPDLIQALAAMGIRVAMITGDGKATAQSVASQLGLQGEVVNATELHKNPKLALSGSVFAEVYPEDKLMIVKALQEAGHTVGMTGDGVNDAPALRQAEVGIAVAGATDVAKQAASFILTNPGLEGIVAAVKGSRQVYARIRTWALNKIIKSVEVSLFTSIIFLVTQSYILSPMVAILLLLANDFVAISIATDRAKAASKPAHWRVGELIRTAGTLALVPLSLMMGLFFVGLMVFKFPLEALRTVTFAGLVTLGQASLYGIRSWPHAWSVRPGSMLIKATIFSLGFTVAISLLGGPVAAIPGTFLILVGAASLVSFFLVDTLHKAP